MLSVSLSVENWRRRVRFGFEIGQSGEDKGRENRKVMQQFCRDFRGDSGGVVGSFVGGKLRA